MSTDPRDAALRERYAIAGAPYGQSEEGFDRWCAELEDAVFGNQRDPRAHQPQGNIAILPIGPRRMWPR